MQKYANNPEYNAIGIDVYPWNGVDMVIKSSSDLPFSDASFDTVCCIAALNHIPEREGFLQEARRVLRPHGRLVLTMIPPGISRIWHFLRSPWDADQRERGMAEGEVYGLSPHAMKTLLETAGFSILCVRCFMLGINKLYVAEKRNGNSPA
jgi:SAM-dependent methyltransferase